MREDGVCQSGAPSCLGSLLIIIDVARTLYKLETRLPRTVGSPPPPPPSLPPLLLLVLLLVLLPTPRHTTRRERHQHQQPGTISTRRVEPTPWAPAIPFLPVSLPSSLSNQAAGGNCWSFQSLTCRILWTRVWRRRGGGEGGGVVTGGASKGWRRPGDGGRPADRRRDDGGAAVPRQNYPPRLTLLPPEPPTNPFV